MFAGHRDTTHSGNPALARRLHVTSYRRGSGLSSHVRNPYDGKNLPAMAAHAGLYCWSTVARNPEPLPDTESGTRCMAGKNQL